MDLDYSHVIVVIYEFVLSLAAWTSSAWAFFTDVHIIGFNIQPIDNALGVLVNWFINLLNTFSFEFSFLGLFSGTVILSLMVAYLIKTFIPVA